MVEENKTPLSFFLELHSAICKGYERTYKQVEEEEFNLAFEPHAFGIWRHHQVNKFVEKEMARASYISGVRPTETGSYSFVEVGFERLRITIARGKEDITPNSDYRKRLRDQNQMLFSDNDIKPLGIVNCELIHGPKKDDPKQIEFAEMWYTTVNGDSMHFDFLDYVNSISNDVLVKTHFNSASQITAITRTSDDYIPSKPEKAKPQPEVKIRKPVDSEEGQEK
jgi:hypothetical protein